MGMELVPKRVIVRSERCGHIIWRAVSSRIGTSFWFYPQIFRYLDERGLGPDKIFSVLTGDVVSKSALKSALLAAYPTKRTVIEQVFSRY